MDIEDIDNDATVKVRNEDNREVILSRYAVKLSFEGGDSNISLCIEKLRLVFK